MKSKDTYYTFNKRSRTQLLAKFKKVLLEGFRATLNFPKIKVAITLATEFFKLCQKLRLTTFIDVDNIKNIHRAVFEIYTPKAVIMGVFSK